MLKHPLYQAYQFVCMNSNITYFTTIYLNLEFLGFDIFFGANDIHIIGIYTRKLLMKLNPSRRARLEQLSAALSSPRPFKMFSKLEWVLSASMWRVSISDVMFLFCLIDWFMIDWLILFSVYNITCFTFFLILQIFHINITICSFFVFEWLNYIKYLISCYFNYSPLIPLSWKKIFVIINV